MPETSIVIRTFNEAKHIGNLLEGIQNQHYKNYEIVMVDSGSTDGTLEIAKKYPVKIISIQSRDFTFGYSLNVGCKASMGKYLVFVSGHVIPTDDAWLTNLIRPFNNERRAMVYGKQVGNAQSKFSERIDFNRLFGTKPINSKKLLTYANNANSAIRKSLWEETKFDEHLFGLEDIDWARKMIEKGYRVYYEPTAPVYHIHEEQWYQVFNRYRREAIAAVRIGLPRPPQARLNVFWLCWFVFMDFLHSFPNYSDRRINEIVRFRYFQWKGSRVGWQQGKTINFERDKNTFFYPTDTFAVVIKQPGKADLVELPRPDMRPGDILIKVDYVGVNQTDIDVYDGKHPYYRSGRALYPIVPGHEFSGTIVKIGSNNTFQERFRIGDRVIGERVLTRGKEGEYREVGVRNAYGAYAKHVVMPGDFIHKVPDDVTQETAALTEPLAIVLRALHHLEPHLSKSSKIAIIGAGHIGNFCAQVLAQRGHHVYVFDRNVGRQSLLKEVVESVGDTVRDVSSFDILIDATRTQLVAEHIMHESAVGSTVLLFGSSYTSGSCNLAELVEKEKVVLTAPRPHKADFEHALELLPKLKTASFVNKILPLQDFKEAWHLHGRHAHVKILLQP